jgi:DNA-directed RNA polymerase subunit RPC12/RpoP
MSKQLYKGKPAVKRRVVEQRQTIWRRGIVGWELTLNCGHIVIRSNNKYNYAYCEECGAIEKPEE